MSIKSTQPLLPTKTVIVPDHEQAGRMMREHRVAAGLSIQEVADKLGVSASYVSNLERGRQNWSEERVAKYLAALQ